MKNILALLTSALLLSVVLTLSHALLRAAALYTPFALPWFIRVAPALLLYGVVFIVYTFLLKYFYISLLYPIYTAISIIGVSLVGIAYFGESFTYSKLIGMTFLLLGISLISL
jgi:small multidrug resistance pump